MPRKSPTRRTALLQCRRRVWDNSAVSQPAARTDSREFRRTATKDAVALQTKGHDESCPYKTERQTLTQRKTLVLAGGLRWGFRFFARGHGNDDVFALLAV